MVDCVTYECREHRLLAMKMLCIVSLFFGFVSCQEPCTLPNSTLTTTNPNGGSHSGSGSLYVGTYPGLYYTDNGGASWLSVAAAGQRPVHALIREGNTILAGDDIGDIYRSTDSGANWSRVSATITDVEAFTAIGS